jgi:heme o synthase
MFIEPNLIRPDEIATKIANTIVDYYQLTKPRIIPLLVATSTAAMLMAGKGQVTPTVFLATLIGGILAAAGAQVVNCIYDRDIDYDMERTRDRPIPGGRISIVAASIYAIALTIAAFVILAVGANLVAASWAMAGSGFYILVYTHLLKRHTPQNIVIGGAAGAMPVLVGWSAAIGHLEPAAWIFFAIVFFWTPPHFWALALTIGDEYAAVNIPMLPVVAGDVATVKQIKLYAIALIPLCAALVYPLHAVGWLYAVVAIVLNYRFWQKILPLADRPHDRQLAKSLFKNSIFYMLLLCAAMAMDSFF